MKWAIVGLAFLAISIIPGDALGTKKEESAVWQDEEANEDGAAGLPRLIGGRSTRHDTLSEDLEDSIVENIKEVVPEGHVRPLEKEEWGKGGGASLSHSRSRFGKVEDEGEEGSWDPSARSLGGRDRAMTWSALKETERRPTRTHLRSLGEPIGMRSAFKEEGGWGEDGGGFSVLTRNSSDLPSRNLSAWRTVLDPDNKPFNLSGNDGLLGLRRSGAGECARDILWKAMGEPTLGQLERLLVRLIDAKRLEEHWADYEDKGGSLLEESEEAIGDEEKKTGGGSALAGRFLKGAGARKGWLMDALVQKGKDFDGTSEGRGIQSFASDGGGAIDGMMKRLKTDIVPFAFGGILNRLLAMPEKEKPDFVPVGDPVEEEGETVDEMIERLSGGNERSFQPSYRTPILFNNLLVHRRPCYHHQEHQMKQVSQDSERDEEWGDRDNGEGMKEAEGKPGGEGSARASLSQKNLAHSEVNQGVEDKGWLEGVLKKLLMRIVHLAHGNREHKTNAVQNKVSQKSEEQEGNLNKTTFYNEDKDIDMRVRGKEKNVKCDIDKPEAEGMAGILAETIGDLVWSSAAGWSMWNKKAPNNMGRMKGDSTTSTEHGSSSTTTKCTTTTKITTTTTECTSTTTQCTSTTTRCSSTTTDSGGSSRLVGVSGRDGATRNKTGKLSNKSALTTTKTTTEKSKETTKKGPTTTTTEPSTECDSEEPTTRKSKKGGNKGNKKPKSSSSESEKGEKSLVRDREEETLGDGVGGKRSEEEGGESEWSKPKEGESQIERMTVEEVKKMNEEEEEEKLTLLRAMENTAMEKVGESMSKVDNSILKIGEWLGKVGDVVEKTKEAIGDEEGMAVAKRKGATGRGVSHAGGMKQPMGVSFVKVPMPMKTLVLAQPATEKGAFGSLGNTYILRPEFIEAGRGKKIKCKGVNGPPHEATTVRGTDWGGRDGHGGGGDWVGPLVDEASRLLGAFTGGGRQGNTQGRVWEWVKPNEEELSKPQDGHHPHRSRVLSNCVSLVEQGQPDSSAEDASGRVKMGEKKTPCKFQSADGPDGSSLAVEKCLPKENEVQWKEGPLSSARMWKNVSSKLVPVISDWPESGASVQDDQLAKTGGRVGRAVNRGCCKAQCRRRLQLRKPRAGRIHRKKRLRTNRERKRVMVH